MTTILTEALQNSFSGLRQAMESGFNDLGNVLSANYREDDASVDEEKDSLANELHKAMKNHLLKRKNLTKVTTEFLTKLIQMHHRA